MGSIEIDKVIKNTQAVINQEDSLERILPFSSVIDDGLVCTKSGDFVSTWRVAGMNFEGLTDEEIYSRMDALNLFIRGLANGKFAFWIHRIRRFASDALEIPTYNNFTKNFITAYYEKLSSEKLMQTELYLTIVYRPKPAGQKMPFEKLSRNKDDIKLEINKAKELMHSINRQVQASLDKYRPSLLGNYQFEGKTFSKQLEFYGYLVNGCWWRIPVKVVPLNQYLPVSRVLFGNEIIEMRDTYGSQYGAFVDIKDYPDFSEAGILNTLLNLNCEYVETHSFSPLSTLDAQSALRKQRNQMISSEDNAISQLELIDVAIDQVSSGNFSLGEYHYSLLIKGRSPEEVRKYRSDAIELLNSSGFLGVNLDLVTSLAFSAQVPCNWRFRPREAKLSSKNFVGLCSLHAFQQGKRDGNPWGEATTILTTPSKDPYYFNFHDTKIGDNAIGDKALGNAQIIGKSGGGKTVLALFLMINLLKYGTQTVFFDKDRGAEIAIRAMGGKYLSLERTKPTGLAPFKMEPTPGTITFWRSLVKYCSRFNNEPLTPTDEEQINLAVNSIASMPKEARSFKTLLQMLPSANDNNIAQRLQKWCAGNELGWALDCSSDQLVFEDGRPYGFDYTEILDDEDVRGPIMMYLMYRVEELIDGRLFAFFMDEYWKALSVDYFEDFAKNKQKTIRKQNGLGVYMTQSPSDALNSNISKTLIEQTSTYIFLPNPTADYDDYVGGFKLTEAEYLIVKELKESSRMFLIKQGDKVALAQLDLGDFKNEIKILSGTTDGVERLDSLRARLGDDPNNWIEPFLKGES